MTNQMWKKTITLRCFLKKVSESLCLYGKEVGGKMPHDLCSVLTVWARRLVSIDLKAWAGVAVLPC